MKKIKLLDLCCKAGGCSMGYYQAACDLGFDIDIVGVDIEAQPNYPFTFIQDDALFYLKRYFDSYTHIHASPPCQLFSVSTIPHRAAGKQYVDILTSLLLFASELSLPFVFENVPGSPLRPDIVLRGDMFGLKVLRKRIFQCVNWWSLTPQLPFKRGSVSDKDFLSICGKASWTQSRKDRVKIPLFSQGTVIDTWRYAMGIDWMRTDAELSNAIPPSYTRFIGQSFFSLQNI